MPATPEDLRALVDVVDDPRRDQGKMYPLDEILLLVLFATIAGATDLVGVCVWARARIDWLRGVLEMRHGVPSHDTLARVLDLLDPDQLAGLLASFLDALAPPPATASEQIALDGKSVRRAWDKAEGGRALHLLQAWSRDHDAILAVLRVEGHENEIVAIPRILELLDLSGQVVTIDAIGCQREIARQIKRQGGDYVLRLKANHPDLLERVDEFFTWAHRPESGAELALDACTSGGHGRVEERRVSVAEVKGRWMQDESRRNFPGLRSVVRVESVRWEASNGEESVEYRYYLSSLGPDASRHQDVIRGHWGIENCAHWTLDVAMGEDASRMRSERGAVNLAVLRRLALARLRAEKSAKVGVKNKMLRCSADLDYLVTVLLG